MRDDLTRTKATVTYDDDWSGGTSTTTNTVGQWQTGLALRLGIEGGSF